MSFTPSKAERDLAMKQIKERGAPKNLLSQIADLEQYAKGIGKQRLPASKAQQLRKDVAEKIKGLKMQLALAERKTRQSTSKAVTEDKKPAPPDNKSQHNAAYNNKGKIPTSAAGAVVNTRA